MKRLFILILALLTALMMASCKKAEEPAEPEADTDNGYRRTTLYYATEDGFIVPVMKSIPWEEGIGRAALSYLDYSGVAVAPRAQLRRGQAQTRLPDPTQ